MGVDPDGSLAAFKRLLEQAKATPETDAPVALTEALAGAERAPVLRICAIPHEFGRDLFRSLWEWRSSDEADECYDAFSELSIVHPSATGLSIHDRWRKPLWAWWLREENRAEFTQISRRLLEYFSGPADPASGAAGAEALLREHMYHLIGADRAAGLTMFESLCQRARHQWRFTECAMLIRLVHDYDPILAPDEQAMLAYHEGKLATDQRDWERAEDTFRSIERNPSAPAPLRVKALVRVGHAQRELRRLPDAIATLKVAQSIAQHAPAAQGLRWRILIELGEAYRDTGSIESAEETLKSAIDAARLANEPADLAGLFNSLGTVYLRQRAPDRAIEAFRESLAQLERAGDVFRPAQVQNNLALAHFEQRDWAAAEAAFAKSLELKRQAGDLPGQGLALQNLSRVQAAQERLAEAVESSAAAAALFALQGDKRRAGIAKLALSKYVRRQGDIAGARGHIEEAESLFQAAGDSAGAASARQELRALERGIGLPLWAKVLLWIGGLVLAAWVVLLIVVLVEEIAGGSTPDAPQSAPAGTPQPEPAAPDSTAR